MNDYKPTSQTLISREYQNGPDTAYDKLLDTTRWNGPNITHNFYKCWSKKDKKAEEFNKLNKSAPGAIKL